MCNKLRCICKINFIEVSTFVRSLLHLIRQSLNRMLPEQGKRNNGISNIISIYILMCRRRIMVVSPRSD